MLPWYELVWPIAGAVVAGGLIGLEREWRGRPAGFRTHILVSLSSCLLMLAALHQPIWAFDNIPADNIMTDPTRMAHGILTGIGFLCAGVIVRQGFSIHGLTTAASLWMTAAIGMLFGAGLPVVAITGAIVTAVILVGLKLISSLVPSRVTAEIRVEWKRGDRQAAERVQSILSVPKAGLRSGRYALSADGAHEVRCWRFRINDRSRLTQIASDLSNEPGVTGFEISPHDD
ncbi:MgtC/SapB family protein [uncultured Brevundimonas sp.]|uniref:MgtC/SapB family protein n=1 Tax=uncultured Brevundimonas sp. TaxID=213418 RepID=UPI00262E2871|nr:MgtC/SapB family protein [uncultured Brevundimonas sp.]